MSGLDGTNVGERSHAASASGAWEADVILNDGGIATLRPITAFDRAELRNFYARVSDRSKYLRFFGTHPDLTEEDLRAWLGADGRDRVTLVVTDRARIVGVATYRLVEQLLPERVADVAFLVQDSHHGRGVGNILLEHLAEVGREQGIDRFVAEMLPKNRNMVQTFVRAGYSAKPELADGLIAVDFAIATSPVSREVMERREQRAEANSLRRLLHPRSIAVLGTADDVSGVVSTLKGAGFTGDIHEVATQATDGNPAEALESAAPEKTADLVLISQSPDLFDDLDEVMAAAARRDAYGVAVLASNVSPGVSSESAQRVVDVARDYGLRALGPAALGLVNTEASVSLNATPAPLPRQGGVGVFAQSAGVATVMLSQVLQHGTGVSNFLGSGLFSDVTGNDVMQFWSTDERTRVCLLSLDAVGNPRKFFRVLRRLALVKHVIVFMPSRALVNARHYGDVELAQIGAAGVDEVIRGTGAMVVSRRETMFNVAQILARQPVPRGSRVAVVSNSSGLLHQMEQSAVRFGLTPVAVPVPASPVEDPVLALDQALSALLGSGGDSAPPCAQSRIDAVVVTIAEAGEPLLADARTVLDHHAAAGSSVPLIASLVGFGGLGVSCGFGEDGTCGEEELGQLPVIDNYADALEAISLIAETQRRRELAKPTPVDEFPAIQEDAKQSVQHLVEEALAQSVLGASNGHKSSGGRWVSDAEATAILGCYGIDVEPWQAVESVEGAIEAAGQLGWDVVLKSTNRVFKGRPELPSVIRHIASPEEMRLAWKKLMAMAREVGLDPNSDLAAVQPVVQATVPSGTTLTVSSVEDAALGPMTSVGVAGLASEVLGDVSYCAPPLRRSDARRMLLGLKSAGLLTGGRGLPPVNLIEVEEIIMRLSVLTDDHPSIVEVELYPVVAAEKSTSVVGARVKVAPLGTNRDPSARAL